MVEAGLPAPRLDSIFPAGGQTGSTVIVGVSGGDLEGPRDLMFSDPAIKAVREGDNRFRVTVGDQVVPGRHEVRFAGRFGISNPRCFVVSRLPQVVEAGDHHSLSTAQEVPLDAVIHGRSAAERADYFKVAVKAGQRVLISCESHEIDSRMEAVVVLYDGSGRELARSRREAALDYRAHEDGALIVKVYDLLFRGGGDYFYRLSIHSRPVVDFALPLALPERRPAEATLYGRNLPGAETLPEITLNGAELETMRVEIPAAEEGDRKALALFVDDDPAALGAYRRSLVLPIEGGAESGFVAAVARAPVMTEAGYAAAGEAGKALAAPVSISGHFHPSGDVDEFEVTAKKGAVYEVEVISSRLGLPTHPHLLIQKVSKDEKGAVSLGDLKELYDDGSNLGGKYFNTATFDLRWRWEVKEDGVYRFSLRDLFNPGGQSDPRRAYNLEIRAPHPDFGLAVMAQEPLAEKDNSRELFVQDLSLRRGEALPLKVFVRRLDGFNGPVELEFEGLPEGVAVAPKVVPAGASSTWVMLAASADAKGGASLIRVFGKADIGGKQVRRESAGATLIWKVGDDRNEPARSRMTSTIGLAVVGEEQAPVSVRAGDGRLWEAPEGGKLEIPVTVARLPEFGADLKLDLIGHGAFKKFPDLAVKGKETQSKLVIDLAKYKLPPGIHRLYLTTQTKGKYRRMPEEVTRTESEKKAAEARLAEAATVRDAAAKELAAAEKAVKEAEKLPEDRQLERMNALEKASEKVMQAEAAFQAAEVRSQQAAAAAKRAADRAKPRDVTTTVYSSPLEIEVKATPKQAKK